MPEPHPDDFRETSPQRSSSLPLLAAWSANLAAFALTAAAAMRWVAWELGIIGMTYIAGFCIWGTHALLRQRAEVRRMRQAQRQLVDTFEQVASRHVQRRAQTLQAEIDARKTLQENLQRRVDNLYRRVAEQADYAAMIAHELRTPLGVIDMAAQALASLPLAEQETAAMRLHRIRRGVQRIGALAEGLRPGTSGECPTVPELQPMWLSSLVLHVIEHYGATSSVRLAIRDEIVLSGDAALLEILLANLLDNARKYAPGAPVELNVWREPGEACIEVADGGPGLNDEELERVFHRNFRGSRVPRQAPGTGLGLFVARRIAEGHGGQLTARNRSVGGCSFLLRLPLTQPAA